jgi:hypothetical protein
MPTAWVVLASMKIDLVSTLQNILSIVQLNGDPIFLKFRYFLNPTAIEYNNLDEKFITK